VGGKESKKCVTSAMSLLGCAGVEECRKSATGRRSTLSFFFLIPEDRSNNNWIIECKIGLLLSLMRPDFFCLPQMEKYEYVRKSRDHFVSHVVASFLVVLHLI
jgi:hypothetical protein